MRKGLRNIGLAGVLTVGLAGCQDTSQDFITEGGYQGYSGVIGIDGHGRWITLLTGDSPNDGYLRAEDYENDGRFDRLKLIDIPKGHSIEQLANFEDMERAYKYIKEHGDKQ
ncbi:MAG: hypothetical protein IH948_10740 [Bacteroidetes bacterium]|nr:hypothetical protein [Bacteroidota bacterium]